MCVTLLTFHEMETRIQMLRVAEAQLQASPQRDISTRAVCEAVGVGAPVLYRLFGDKNGLLSAVVDRAFQRYLASKRDQVLSDDPVATCMRRWMPASRSPLIRPCIGSPMRRDWPPSRAAFKNTTTATQAPGTLRRNRQTEHHPDEAAQIMMAACAGVALRSDRAARHIQPSRMSHRIRDTVFAKCLSMAVRRIEKTTF